MAICRLLTFSIILFTAGFAAAEPAIAAPATTTTTVSSAPNPSVYGESVTLTATVTINPPDTGTPTGAVTFSDGAGFNQVVPLDAAGQAVATTGALSTGTVTATFTSDSPSLFGDSSGTVLAIVNPADTTTSVSASPNVSVFGQLVTLTATVTVVAPGAGIPTGTVTFSDGAGLNQTVALVGGVANVPTSALTTGTVFATYNGSPAFSGSVASTFVTVNQAGTSTSVTATPNPSDFGQSVSVCATVAIVAPGSGTPTGTVTFTATGGLNQTATVDAGGVACITSNTLVTGTITAVYNGDTNALMSMGTTSVTVNPASTTTVVTAAPNPSVAGESVTVTATVTAVGGTPTGSVTFTEPGGATQTVPLAGGAAAYTSSTLTTGTVTATYNTDDSAAFGASTGTVAVNVNQAATTTTVTATPNPSTYGETVTLSAAVAVNAPGSGTPTGTVTFTGPGGFSQTVAIASGVASVTTNTLATGTGTITATYGGDTLMAPSAGTASITVNPATTQTTVTSSLNPSELGQSVTFTATVTSGGGTPTGSVTFSDGGSPLGTVTLAGGVATFTTSTLTLGTHSITAAYAGDGGFVASASTALSQSVAVPADSVNLRSMQVLASRVEAAASGKAFTDSVQSAISEAFSDGDSLMTVTPDGMRLSYALEGPGSSVPWPNGQAAGSDWTAWADISTSGLLDQWNDSDDLSGMQVNGLLGLSHKLSPDLVVGVLGGYEAFAYKSVDLDAKLEGTGWTVGGYVGGRADRLRYFLAAGYTGLGYDASAGIATGSFDAQRMIVSGGLSGSFDTLGMTVEPSLNIFGLWEHQDAYTDSLGVDQAQREFSSGRVSAGIRLMHEFDADSGMTVLPYAGLYADYAIGDDDAELVDLGLGSTGAAPEGATGRVTGGVDLGMPGGASLHFGGEIGGLGGDRLTWSVEAGMKAPL